MVQLATLLRSCLISESLANVLLSLPIEKIVKGQNVSCHDYEGVMSVLCTPLQVKVLPVREIKIHDMKYNT